MISDAARQIGHAIAVAFRVTQNDLLVAEIDILDPQPAAFQYAKSRSVKQPGDQLIARSQLDQYLLDFLGSQHNRQPFITTSPLRPAQVPERNVVHLREREQQRAEGLILCTGSHVPIDGQVLNERFHLSRGQFARFATVVKVHKPVQPFQVGLLSPDCVMGRSKCDLNLLVPLGHCPIDRREGLTPGRRLRILEPRQPVIDASLIDMAAFEYVSQEENNGPARLPQLPVSAGKLRALEFEEVDHRLSCAGTDVESPL